MIDTTNTLGSQNVYKAGYNEGVEDVFVAFNDMMHTIKDDNTFLLFSGFYEKLSKKFPQSEGEEE